MKFVAVLDGKATPLEIVRVDEGYRLTIENKTFTVDAVHTETQAISLLVDGKSYEIGIEKREHNYSVQFYNDTISLELHEARNYKAGELAKKSSSTGPVKITAPMPGKIIKVIVSEDIDVREGDPLLIIEAMKMQNELKAPRAGRVHQIHAKSGDAVSPQQTLMILE